MRKIIILSFVIFFLVINQRAIAVSWWWPPTNEATIVPDNPTSADVVTITLSGDWPNKCTPVGATTSIVGNNIYFDVIANPGEKCQEGVVPWTQSKSVGWLSVGSYVVYARLINDPCDIPAYIVLKEFLVESNPSAPTTYYVDADCGDNNNDGLSPEKAFATIQKGIDTAHGGDTVIVASGVYAGSGNRDITFKGKAVTVKSKSGAEVCTINCEGTKVYPHHGFKFIYGEDVNSVLDGFTITNGDNTYGGGILCENSSPRIINCVFSHNTAYEGGAIYCKNANLIIKECTFTDNSAAHGGAVLSNNSSLSVSDCTFIDNHSEHVSGIRCSGNGNITINNCTFTGGNSTAICCEYGCLTEINRCVITGIYGNATHHAPPAIEVVETGNPTTIKNCLIFNNYSTRWAAGIWCIRCRPIITNCTITGNSSVEKGGGIGCYRAYPEISNCIIWGNEAPNGPQIVFRDSSIPVINYCNIQGNWAGIGNINADPCFADLNIDNYHLFENSPCINTGNPNYTTQPDETDLDGSHRVIGGRIDMGAYEFNPNTSPVACIMSVDEPTEAQYPFGAKVTLDGSCSSDSDSTPGTNDDITDFNWYEIDPCNPDNETLLGSGQIIDCNLPLGTHTIMLEVTDKAGASDSNEITITVQDTTPPEFNLSVSPLTLWPANNKMVKITPSWTVTDLCDESPQVSLVDIKANESVNSGDIQISNDGSIYLRATRSGNKNTGRIYTLVYQACDSSGNCTTRSCTVTVPHDMRK